MTYWKYIGKEDHVNKVLAVPNGFAKPTNRNNYIEATEQEYKDYLDEMLGKYDKDDSEKIIINLKPLGITILGMPLYIDTSRFGEFQDHADTMVEDVKKLLNDRLENSVYLSLPKNILINEKRKND